MNRRHFLYSTLAVAAALRPAAARAQARSAAAKPLVSVYKTPTCGCCTAWMDHLEANGFRVEAREVSDAQLTAISMQHGVTDDVSSCHTARVDNYTVVGHVPAADIHRMLAEKPAILGISVPGMPIGSPGMEQGSMKQPFDTVAFSKGGKKTVFAQHR